MEGCIECKSILDGWNCTKGDNTKPSICSKGLMTISIQMATSATSNART